MRLQTKKVKAKDVPTAVFIFLPKEKRFFFVDDYEHIGNKVILIFEKIDKNGLVSNELVVSSQTYGK